MNVIASLISSADILLNIDVSSKEQVLEEIARHMERVHGLPFTSVVTGLARREQVGTTGLGHGFAIPHARVRNLDRIYVSYLRPTLSIPFDALDGQPVSDILVVLVPKEATEEHLRILADASNLFSTPHFREQLNNCETVQEVKRLFDTWSSSSLHNFYISASSFINNL